MNHPNIEIVQRIDFDKLDMLVCERIGALKIYAKSIDKATEGREAHEAICRDLIIPCVSLLMQFLESVKLNEQADGDDERESE